MSIWKGLCLFSVVWVRQWHELNESNKEDSEFGEIYVGHRDICICIISSPYTQATTIHNLTWNLPHTSN